MKNWYKVTFTPKQVRNQVPEKIEHDFDHTHLVNDQPLLDVELFEREPKPEDGSRVYFFSPECINHVRDLIEPYNWELSEKPEASEVRAAGAFL